MVRWALVGEIVERTSPLELRYDSRNVSSPLFFLSYGRVFVDWSISLIAFCARVLPDWGWAGCASQTIVDEAGLAACEMGLETLGVGGLDWFGLVILVASGHWLEGPILFSPSSFTTPVVYVGATSRRTRRCSGAACPDIRVVEATWKLGGVGLYGPRRGNCR
jgi:hypothetical protein